MDIYVSVRYSTVKIHHKESLCSILVDSIFFSVLEAKSGILNFVGKLSINETNPQNLVDTISNIINCLP